MSRAGNGCAGQLYGRIKSGTSHSPQRWFPSHKKRAPERRQAMKRSTLLYSTAMLALSSTFALAEGAQRQDMQRQDQSNPPAAQQQAPATRSQGGSAEPSANPNSP